MRVAVYQLNKELAKSEAILIDEGKDLSTANAKLYDAMDNEETVGVEAFADDGPTPEEQAITQEIYDRLHRAIDALPKAERELIKALYFEGMTEQEYAEAKKMRQSTVSYRRLRTLSKMKKFCCFLGSF